MSAEPCAGSHALINWDMIGRIKDERLTVDGHGMFDRRFEKPGVYAVRIPSVPTAMGNESAMTVQVRIVELDADDP